MAQEFLKANNAKTRAAFTDALKGVALTHEPHIKFKQRIPHAIGLIRTGDPTQYANIVLASADYLYGTPSFLRPPRHRVSVQLVTQ